MRTEIVTSKPLADRAYIQLPSEGEFFVFANSPWRVLHWNFIRCGSLKRSAARQTFLLSIVRDFDGSPCCADHRLRPEANKQTRSGWRATGGKRNYWDFTQQRRNGGAVRQAEGRSESRFRLLNELRSADPPACLSRRRDAFGPHGTSRQSNTHSTELREIRYPWHPWYGCPVWIHEALVKAGQAVYRCSLEQNQEARLFEIPQWMFESGCAPQ